MPPSDADAAPATQFSFTLNGRAVHVAGLAPTTTLLVAKNSPVQRARDLNGKVVGTTGHTMHIYEGGRIKRESTYWDATSVLRDLGQPVSAQGVTAPRVSAPVHV